MGNTNDSNNKIDNDVLKEANLETMEHNDLVEKINYYTAITKKRDLTSKESEEREIYRKEYLRRIRQNLRSQLNTIKKN